MRLWKEQKKYADNIQEGFIMKYMKKSSVLATLLSLVFVLTSCGSKVGGDAAQSAWEQVAPTKDTQSAIDNPESVITDVDGEAVATKKPAKDKDTNTDDETRDGDTNDNSDSNEDEAAKMSLVMVGDMLFHKAVSDSGLQSDGTYNYDAIFANVKDDIKAADVAIVNQEVILGGKELGLTGYPTFNAAYEVGDAIANAGFDVVLHATNHTLDKGKTGMDNCMNYWKTNHPDMVVAGLHDSEEDQKKIRVCEANGIKIAILNYTYGTNGIPLPSDRPYAVDLLDEAKIREDVKNAKEVADFVVVCPHWGTEYVLEESSEQKKWADLFLELGVDLVIGTHPHVIEPVKMLESDNGHKMLVYYSLGNFINSTASTEKNVGRRYVGGMAKVTLAKKDGKVIIEDYGIEPLVTQNESGTNGITTYKLSDYTEEMAKKNKAKQRDSAFSLEYCKELVRQVFGDLYKE